MMIAAPAVAQHAPAYRLPKPALLCIERSEQNGSLNIIPTEIIIADSPPDADDGLRVSLTGGQNVCFRLSARRVEIKVRFPPGSTEPGAPKTFWTSSFPIKLRGGINDYSLEDTDAPREPSADNEDGWHRLWRLQRVNGERPARRTP